jgi:hypothetical protein
LLGKEMGYIPPDQGSQIADDEEMTIWGIDFYARNVEMSST